MGQQIDIDSDAIRSAAGNIEQSIQEVNRLATSIKETLSNNAGAYGQGDVDEAKMHSSVDEIGSQLAENAQTIEESIQILRNFADQMDAIVA